MSVADRVREALARLLGFDQEDDLLVPPEDPAAAELASAGLASLGAGGAPPVVAASDPTPAPTEAPSESAEPEAETQADAGELLALVSDELIGAQDEAEDADAEESQDGSAGFGEFSMDLFSSESAEDEDRPTLPEGLVEVDALALLSDCSDIATRLEALPRDPFVAPKGTASNEEPSEAPG